MDRPALVLVASGGAVTGQARQPDHLTGHVTDILATIGIRGPRFVYLEELSRPERAGPALAAAAPELDRISHFGAL